MRCFLSAGKAGPLAPHACMKTSHSELDATVPHQSRVTGDHEEGKDCLKLFPRNVFHDIQLYVCRRRNPIAMATNIV